MKALFISMLTIFLAAVVGTASALNYAVFMSTYPDKTLKVRCNDSTGKKIYFSVNEVEAGNPLNQKQSLDFGCEYGINVRYNEYIKFKVFVYENSPNNIVCKTSQLETDQDDFRVTVNVEENDGKYSCYSS
ncbi:MAG: hypothetical protein CMF50_06415 [Legionellales bacterium]|nr:hypothetical protein [Legionellales bacterium]|tara:strand:- start:12883 stop:13275 length:393 start_codon:yes stop_codon:yes gene_type:complete